jgi:5-methylcytosine-specific restriction endonuclease McrA
MPISPENMALYPGGSIRSREWLAIREQVRERAGNRCQQCGVPNHAIGAWSRHEQFIISAVPVIPGDTISWDGEKLRVIRIVCTVAHVEPVQLGDHSLDNLRFWCQRCHNRHDAPMRAASRKARA